VSKEQVAVIEAIRRCSVTVLAKEKFDPVALVRENSVKEGDATYYVQGNEIWISRSLDWPKYLASALAHVAHLEVHHDLDANRQDRNWFRAALDAVGYAQRELRESYNPKNADPGLGGVEEKA
jgi:hypothetical protein